MIAGFVSWISASQLNADSPIIRKFGRMDGLITGGTKDRRALIKLDFELWNPEPKEQHSSCIFLWPPRLTEGLIPYRGPAHSIACF